MSIAQTILEQLGGNRFIAMTGARNFVSIPYGLRFRLPCRKVNVVEITLTPMDEYNMRFWLVRGENVKEVRSYGGIDCDQLEELFTEATGLYTRL